MKLQFILIPIFTLVINNCGEDNKESSWPYPDGTLFINEIMALNKITYCDEFKEFDDWIELYNAGSDTINIGGLFISDNLDLLTKCRITDSSMAKTIILPDSFLVIWFDSQPLQGPLHVGCNLSGSGEDVVITADDGTSVIDRHTYEPQTIGYSTGRSPDGVDNWILYKKPTPGSSNQ